MSKLHFILKFTPVIKYKLEWFCEVFKKYFRICCVSTSHLAASYFPPTTSDLSLISRCLQQGHGLCKSSSSPFHCHGGGANGSAAC